MTAPQRCKLPLLKRSFLDRRYVHKNQWQKLKQLQALLMEPQDFYAKWDITFIQMAAICFCDRKTVHNWFTPTLSRREAKVHHKLLLGITNKLWTDLLNREES
jgi:hypothetical protein